MDETEKKKIEEYEKEKNEGKNKLEEEKIEESDVKENDVKNEEVDEAEKLTEKIENDSENIESEEKENLKVDGEDSSVNEDESKAIITREGNKVDVVPPKKEKTRKKLKIFFIVFFVIILFLCLTIGGFFCYNKLNTKVYRNVFIFGMDMSKMTEEEVSKSINDYLSNINEKINTVKIDVYQNEDNIYSINPQDIEFKIDVAETVKKVMNYGRESNIFVNNLNIFMALFKDVNITPSFTYNNDKLSELVKNIELTLKDRFVDDKYSVDEKTGTLVITRGKTGNTLDNNTEMEKIVELLNNIYTAGNFDESYSLKLDIISRKPNELDLQKVYQEVKRDAKDAYIDKSQSPVKLVEEVVGYDFSVEDLKKELDKEENKQDGKVINFKLTIIEPKVKLKDITYTLYNDKLAGYTTYFDPSQWARANNLEIALRYLNERVVMPGETFSYNDAIGDTTAAKGYKPAATFKGGTVVDEMGGGICQTTSTLYNVVLMANLEIVERHQHGLPVGYVPPSRDATVYSPTLDFKFKNNRNYPIKIVTSYSSSGSLNISIYGTKEETEYEVVLSHKYLGTIPFTTKYIYDNTLPEGTTQIVSAGVNGYTSEGYITKKLNGVVVSSELLSKDTYKAQQQIVKVGTKK